MRILGTSSLETGQGTEYRLLADTRCSKCMTSHMLTCIIQILTSHCWNCLSPLLRVTRRDQNNARKKSHTNRQKDHETNTSFMPPNTRSCRTSSRNLNLRSHATLRVSVSIPVATRATIGHKVQPVSSCVSFWASFGTLNCHEVVKDSGYSPLLACIVPLPHVALNIIGFGSHASPLDVRHASCHRRDEFRST